METAFLPVAGIEEMPLDLESEVVMTSGNFEVALALDNTGSMEERNKIGALKEAANELVDILYEEDGAESRVKMALVPFTTTVNIRGAAFKPEWLDPMGAGLGEEHQFDSFDREVNRLDIFAGFSAGRRGPDGLPTAWKGCVEAREGGLDVEDTEPGADPVTRWTPYLAPDGADGGSGPSYARANSYLRDEDDRGSALERMRDVEKYFPPRVRRSFSDTVGPNISCRNPIIELTNDRERMRAAINGMETGGNTHIPEGLAWGWRVLSPEEPFNQGAKYDNTKTQKALVLLSDGANTVPTTYSSYGFLADGRLGTDDMSRAKRKLDEKVTAICESVKAKNIRLYMILFQVNDRDTQRIFENCASVNDITDEPYYYYAPDAEALTRAFQDIGDDLTSLRITR
jgi:Mg-chelatase subunit ChlD